MNTLMQASYEFMKRPNDERFVNLHTLDNHCNYQMQNSKQAVVSSKKINFKATDDNRGVLMEGRENNAMLTHWSFNQVASLSGVPSKLLRKQCENNLDPLAVDNLNAGMQVIRDVDDVQLYVFRDPMHEFDYANPSTGVTLRAATGPNYGRVFNAEITRELVKRFGNGVGDNSWRVPGIFGKPQETITKEHTTLYASDRDMFVFLADEENRIEIPNRRNNQSGSLARGFFIGNSEVGSKTLFMGFFLFDYMCCNHIIWGVEEFQKIAIRHTASAPDKWLSEIMPTLKAYSRASSTPIEARLYAAQQQKIEDAEAFLNKRGFNNSQVANIMATHMEEENRPIETMWDATTAITAFAKSIPHMDMRIEMEKEGGKILELVKANEPVLSNLASMF